MKWSEVTQSWPTLYDPMDCSLPGSSVHGIFQAIVLEWIAISFSRGSSRPRDWTRVSCIVDRGFTIWATREVQRKRSYSLIEKETLLRKWSFCVKRKHVCFWDMHVCLFPRWGRDIAGLLFTLYWHLTWAQFSSVAQLCLTLCDSMDCNTPVFPVLHQLLEFDQIHVHWIHDIVQPSHPMPSSFPPAFNLSQHQSLFQWVSSSHHVAEVLELQLQHQSFQWIFRAHFH